MLQWSNAQFAWTLHYYLEFVDASIESTELARAESAGYEFISIINNIVFVRVMFGPTNSYEKAVKDT